VQLTIDSDTDLDAALRLVGAFYGVEVTVASGAAAAADQPRSGRGGSRPGRRGAAKKAAARPRKTAARGARRGRRATAPRSNDTAQIRAWAQANGHSVNSRGRIPAPVIEAYRAAH
jgi:hypothetical protein